jgi:hypothetical protein
MAPGIAGKGRDRGNRDQEDDRQAHQQDRQRDLVGGLLALGPFDQRDHAVEEALPGSCVTRTVISSDSTRVPAVTALRSPPASRMTGALSPVMAASLTEATPAITSPSAGIRSPA